MDGSGYPHRLKNGQILMEARILAVADFVKKENTNISFEYDSKLQESYISIKDNDTGKVIRKIPSEEALKFREGIKELLGILFDRRI